MKLELLSITEVLIHIFNQKYYQVNQLHRYCQKVYGCQERNTSLPLSQLNSLVKFTHVICQIFKCL